jgi:hypothetical protein
LFFGDRRERYELVGVADALDALLSKAAKAKPKRGGAKKPAKPKLVFERIECLPDALAFEPDAVFTEEEMKRFPEESVLVRHPDGSIVACAGGDGDLEYSYSRVFRSTGPGDVIELTSGRPPLTREAFWQLQCGPAGRFLYVRSLRQLVRVQIEPFQAVTVFEPEQGESIGAFHVEDDRRCIVLTSGKAWWLDVDDTGIGKVVASTNVTATMYVHAYHAEMDVAVIGTLPGQAKYPVQVYMREGDGAIRLGWEQGWAKRGLVDGDRVFLAREDGSDLRELVGLADVVAHLRGRGAAGA